MNAIQPSAEDAARTARHLAICQELAEIGMRLTRAAADHAIANWAAAPIPTPAPDAPEPPPPPTPPAAKTPDPALTFARLSCAVRQVVTLEARIVADARQAEHPRPTHTRPTHTRRTPPPDPRRAPVRAILHHAVASHPDRADLRADIDDSLEHALAADPEQSFANSSLLDAITEELGITLDFDHLPDDLLDAIIGHADPPDDAA